MILASHEHGRTASQPGWQHIRTVFAVLLLAACSPLGEPLRESGREGCPTRSASQAEVSPLPLHWPVALQLPATASRSNPAGGEQTLRVSLRQHLGRAPQGRSASASGSADVLRLDAVAGELELTDGNGVQHRGRSLRLGWQQRPLAQPVTMERLVVGPLASFESAETVAQAWRRCGTEVVVAYPGPWEVWAAVGEPVPADVPTPRRWQAEQRLETIPVLMGAGAEVPLEGPVRLEAPGGLWLDGGHFAGPFRLARDAHGTWTLMEEVPLERYLEGVVPHEIGAAPPAALRAQAVLARTWALANRHRFATDGYHLCNHQQCQVYRAPQQADTATRAAIGDTAGQVLSWNNQLIRINYHATNGGVKATFEEAWASGARPYVDAGIDGDVERVQQFPLPINDEALRRILALEDGFYGNDHRRFRWQRQLTTDDVQPLADAAGVGTVGNLLVSGRGPSGRVLTLDVVGSDGQLQLNRDQIRRQLPALPSTLFVVDEDAPGVWQFRGGGFGHGVGLSQAGAIDLAARGWDYQAILRHYYPEAMVKFRWSVAAGPERAEG